MAAITLHKFGILPEDEGTHVFTFIFENPQKLLELKSVESSEVSYGGHRWSIVCMRKEERYMGIYLKWRYSDGQSAPSISCKAKYTLSLIHRCDYADNKYFASNQKFTTSQSLLGKSKYIQLSDLLEMSGGFLDETGKRVVLELTISRCTTRYERSVDTSPSARTKKNVSGFYFDTPTFVLANHRWYMRVYPSKANSQGLPAVYLYLASKPKGLSLEVNFRLYLSEDTTELLTYNYGEGAKFDGFGKTLSQMLYGVDKMTSLTVGVEVTAVTIWKDHTLNMREQNVYTPHLYKDYAQYRKGSSHYGGGSYGGLTPVEAFQDQEGNYWKASIDRNAKKLTLIFDKGVHHYQQNKTKLLCWTATLLSRDPDRANDLDMCGEPVVGYFSNFIDEKGYRLVFPVEIAEVRFLSLYQQIKTAAKWQNIA